MSKISKKLAKIVSTENPVSRGKVTQISDTSIFVSTRFGVKEFQVDSPSSYKVGSDVKFQGNTFLGKLPALTESRVHVV